MMHWATSYIGEGYVPQHNDCWAFCRRVWQERFGIDVPVVSADVHSMVAVSHAFQRHAERVHWFEVESPREGDAALMSHCRFPSHVGIWIDVDGGGVLHCQYGIGVVFSSRAALSRSGWGRVQFYRREP